ncbi:transcriptional regulator, partial [Erysipelatoclostridium ramosum]|nr:transcriptional regulator [Thomasclavelia ramosa]
KNSVQYDDLHFGEEIKVIELLLEQLSMMYSYKMQIANELLILLSDSELMKKNIVGKMNLFFLLSYLKKDVESSRIPGIIISHGYSIASGIAEVVNQLVGQHVFDAIDMPISSDVQQITNRLIEKIENTRSCNELIVLVDMGSLEQINNGLGN